MKPFTSRHAALTYFDNVMHGPVSWLERLTPWHETFKVTMGYGRTDLAERWERREFK